MGNTVTVTKVQEGPRNVLYMLTGVMDGSGDENKVKKVDIAALADTPGTKLGIRRITYTTTIPVQLWWDATAPVIIANLFGHDTLDFDDFGSLKNGGGTGSTGSILLSTVGATSGSTYTIKLELIKKV